MWLQVDAQLPACSLSLPAHAPSPCTPCATSIRSEPLMPHYRQGHRRHKCLAELVVSLGCEQLLCRCSSDRTASHIRLPAAAQSAQGPIHRLQPLEDPAMQTPPSLDLSPAATNVTQSLDYSLNLGTDRLGSQRGELDTGGCAALESCASPSCGPESIPLPSASGAGSPW
jgi:hypothetical protein